MSHDEGERCLCVSEHRPAPLELNAHHILPEAAGGQDTPDNLVWLCPTAHANVHELLRLITKANGAFTWTDALALYEQPVNRYAFMIAREGWLRLKMIGA